MELVKLLYTPSSTTDIPQSSELLLQSHDEKVFRVRFHAVYYLRHDLSVQSPAPRGEDAKCTYVEVVRNVARGARNIDLRLSTWLFRIDAAAISGPLSASGSFRESCWTILFCCEIDKRIFCKVHSLSY